jgi:FkbM family methyltransferase
MRLLKMMLIVLLATSSWLTLASSPCSGACKASFDEDVNLMQLRSSVNHTDTPRQRDVRNVAFNHFWSSARFSTADIMDGCSAILFDVGANRGTHVRKLFEPAKYPNATVLKHYDEVFGSAEYRSKPFAETRLCAYGFEPNPRFAQILNDVEKNYTDMKWRVKFLSVAVWSDDRKTIPFQTESNPGSSDWASHVADPSISSSTGNITEVPALNLPSFVQRVLQNRMGDGKVLMKMDIEGSEFQILPRMLEGHLLCTGKIDYFLAEWHERFLSAKDLPAGAALKDKVLQGQASMCSGVAATKAVMFDDESYLLDGQPLPTPAN